MKLALLLLGMITMACAAGSLIPQRLLPAQYTARYGSRLAGVLLALELDRVFTAWWFLLLVGLLVLNLLVCSLLRFPRILKEYREGFSLEARLQKGVALFELPSAPEEGGAFFRRMGFRDARETEKDGARWRYASRRRMGIWGSWLSHLGMLLIVAGFALGQLLLFEASVYGVPGQTLPVPESSLSVTVDAFDIRLREDGTVAQYAADLTVTDGKGGSMTGRTMVNAPLKAFGKDFFQNSTGWAVNLDTYRGTDTLDSRVFFAGESIDLAQLNADHLPLALVFHAFYPDFVNDGNGPRTLSPRLNNPAALFSLYYQGKLVDMNVAGMGYDIKAADYRFVMSEPRPYTLLQVVGDPAAPLTLLGGALMLLGLILAFYFRPEELWMRLDGGGAAVFGRSVRGAALFRDRAEITMKEVKEASRRDGEDSGGLPPPLPQNQPS